MPERVLLSWSAGKDSAWALHVLRRQGYDVVALLTTTDETTGRATVQYVRDSILQAQSQSVGCPLWTVPIPSPCPDHEYERLMGEAMERARREGITHVAFGDLFLADIRAYREAMLAGSGVEPLFPLWTDEAGTATLAREMIESGLAATVTSVDTDQLGAEFAGRRFDAGFLADLPDGVDPLGERGEFHTCCHGGPMFERPIDVVPGETTTDGRFVWVDLSSRSR